MYFLQICIACLGTKFCNTSDTLFFQDTKKFVLILKLSPVVDRSELFTIHLPRLPVTNVGGGAELRALDTVARIEPYGVIQFSEESRERNIPEPENNNFEVNTHADQPQNNEIYRKTHKHYCKRKIMKPTRNCTNTNFLK